MAFAVSVLFVIWVLPREHGPDEEAAAREVAESDLQGVATTNSAGGPIEPPAIPDSRGSAGITPDQEHFSAALRIFGLLKSGLDAESCLGAASDLASLFQRMRQGTELWRWSLELARDCEAAIGDPESRKSYVQQLVRARPDSAGLLILAAEGEWGRGDFESAIHLLEDALKFEESAQAWALLGSSALQYEEVRRLTGGDPDQRQQLIRQAQRAFDRAIALSGGEPDLWVMEGMARAAYLQGQHDVALHWAERTVLAVVAASASETQRLSVSALYFSVGEIYYGVGQRETGVAYMDQALHYAPEHEREAFESRKQRILNRG